MKKYPLTRFVFDRKHVSTDAKKGLLQIEVLHERKKKYISTGVKVFKGQWNNKVGVYNTFGMSELNSRANAVKADVDKFIMELMEKDEEFTFDKLDRHLKAAQKKEMTFLEYVVERIEERGEIRESTKKTQRKLITSLEEFGQIKYFSDLTRKKGAGDKRTLGWFFCSSFIR